MESIKNVAGGIATGLLVLIFFIVGMEHGKALGDLKAVQEYDVDTTPDGKRLCINGPCPMS
jgi:hypothetical protein